MTEAEILDTLVDDFKLDPIYDDTYQKKLIERARQEISEFYPEKKITYLLTVADQTRYVVPTTITDLFKVTHVYYGRETNGMFLDVPLPYSNQAGVPDSSSTFFPSKGIEFIMRMEYLAKLIPAEAFIVDNKTFDLIPTPTESAVRVYYEYDAYRTLANMPVTFMDEMIDLIFWYIADRVYKGVKIKNSGNKYRFDRQGSITTDKDVVNADKDHKQSHEDIVKSIKAKAMKF